MAIGGITHQHGWSVPLARLGYRLQCVLHAAVSSLILNYLFHFIFFPLPVLFSLSISLSPVLSPGQADLSPARSQELCGGAEAAGKGGSW